MPRALFAVVLAASAALARTPREPCPLGRFLTADGHHVLTDVRARVNVIVEADSA